MRGILWIITAEDIFQKIICLGEVEFDTAEHHIRLPLHLTHNQLKNTVERDGKMYEYLWASPLLKDEGVRKGKIISLGEVEFDTADTPYVFHLHLTHNQLKNTVERDGKMYEYLWASPLLKDEGVRKGVSLSPPALITDS
ncbi:hypothetical protein CEXT_365361 [Caerostris extrusa]|uniref:Uncharacterized protein n=1 Tax=Caerostris extrusa TaxID=172846 RepID=A0AAV4X525_CAEEX|nr:hypothetical protein CEXT_365361 [Caerostris extrusa]